MCGSLKELLIFAERRAARHRTFAGDLRPLPGEQGTATKGRIDNFTRFKDRNKRSLTRPCAFRTLGILCNRLGRKIDGVFFRFVFFMSRAPSAFAVNTLPLLWRGAKRLAVPRRIHDIPSTPETDPAQLAHQLIHTSTLSHQKPACNPPAPAQHPPSSWPTGSDLYVYSGFLPAND